MHMKFDPKVLALRIKKMRSKRNMTQEHLAEVVDLSVVYISNVERALRVPSLESMIEICNALGCTMDELLDGFLTAKPSQYPEKVDHIIADCSLEERRFLMKLCTLLKDYLKDTL